MTTYLLIGAVVQLLIIVIRALRGVIDWQNMTVFAYLMIVPFAAVNIVIWPITIVGEIYNTIKGI